jgi:hypothetical protein
VERLSFYPNFFGQYQRGLIAISNRFSEAARSIMQPEVVDFDYCQATDLLTFRMSDKRTVVISPANLKVLRDWPAHSDTFRGPIYVDISGDGISIGPSLDIYLYLPSLLRHWQV